MQALKDEVQRRWGTVDLLDVLKEADQRTGFTEQFQTIATRENLPPELLRRRLLLALFALGTNSSRCRERPAVIDPTGARA